MYFTFSEQNRTFQSMGIWTPGTASVTGVAEPEEVRTEMISDGVLQTLDVPPAVGRWLAQADQDPHGGKTVVLSYGYWARRFGGDRSVMDAPFRWTRRPGRLLASCRAVSGWLIATSIFCYRWRWIAPIKSSAGFGYYGIARLKPGIQLAQADADIARLIPVWMDSWSNGPGTESACLREVANYPRLPFFEAASHRQHRWCAVGGHGDRRTCHADCVH